MRTQKISSVLMFIYTGSVFEHAHVFPLEAIERQPTWNVKSWWNSWGQLCSSFSVVAVTCLLWGKVSFTWKGSQTLIKAVLWHRMGAVRHWSTGMPAAWLRCPHVLWRKQSPRNTVLCPDGGGGVTTSPTSHSPGQKPWYFSFFITIVIT